MKPKTSNKKTAVRTPMIAIAVEKTLSLCRVLPSTVSCGSGASLAKRKSVVSMPKVNSTRISAT